MKKNISIFFSFLIILTELGGCTLNRDNNNLSNNSSESEIIMNNCKLIVEGTDITSECYVEIYDDNKADLPFVAVMEALGAEFQWETPRKAKMVFNNIEYDLNIDSKSLTSKTMHTPYDESILYNLFDHAERYESMDYELILDEFSFRYILNTFNRNMYLDVDSENKTVDIYEGDFSDPYSHKLFVNRKEIVSEGKIRYIGKGEAYVPFVAVMESLGAVFEWETPRKATMRFKDESYELDIDETSIVDKNYPFDNMFSFVGGPQVEICNEKYDNEISLYIYCVHVFLQRTEKDTYLRIYDKEKEINIYFGEQP